MAFSSGVFTSTSGTVNGDGIFVGNKAATAAQLAKEKKMLYGNGISLDPTSAFYVAPVSGLTARISAGWGIMEGYWFEESTDYDITMTSSTSEQTLYVGVRLDATTGAYTDGHVAARTTFVAATDRVFAIIVIPANAVTLTIAMITDTRNNSTYCRTVNAQRTALAALQAEYTEKLRVLESTGIPIHASTHASGGADAIATDATPTSASTRPLQSGGAYTALSSKADLSNGIVAQSQARTRFAEKTSSFTLAAGDIESILLCNSSSAIAVTVPLESTYNFTVGTSFNFIRWGTGALSFTFTSGVNSLAFNSLTSVSAQGGAATLVKVGTNTWWLVCA